MPFSGPLVTGEKLFPRLTELQALGFTTFILEEP